LDLEPPSEHSKKPPPARPQAREQQRKLRTSTAQQ
jgi:hypothetical protein